MQVGRHGFIALALAAALVSAACSTVEPFDAPAVQAHFQPVIDDALAVAHPETGDSGYRPAGKVLLLESDYAKRPAEFDSGATAEAYGVPRAYAAFNTASVKAIAWIATSERPGPEFEPPGAEGGKVPSIVQSLDVTVIDAVTGEVTAVESISAEIPDDIEVAASRTWAMRFEPAKERVGQWLLALPDR